MTCRHPSAGFADPENGKDSINFPVSIGSDEMSFGGRNAPSSAYAGFSPVLENVNGTWTGGMFWDGRATGWTLDDPLAKQAQGPFENPVEMGIDRETVVDRVATSSYAPLFLQVYPDTDFSDIDGTYNNIARAIAAFERSSAVTKFYSKFDRFWQACEERGIAVSEINTTTNLSTLPQGILSIRQLQGLALFNDPGKGNCAACRNRQFRRCRWYRISPSFYRPYLRQPWHTNQLEAARIGGRCASRLRSWWISGVTRNCWIRIGIRQVQGPDPAQHRQISPYGHNGYFATLEDIVHFCNTRDVADWPLPEYADTMSTDLGNLGLSDDEERSIVAFMKSLTDDSK
jgi:cytochrome c peroxidase